MKTGELVENLIYIRDKTKNESDRQALADACNILSKFYVGTSVNEAKEIIKRNIKISE